MKDKKMEDKIKTEVVDGKTYIRWIRIGGCWGICAFWLALPGVDISQSGLRKRVAAGWPPRKAVFKPSRGNAGTVVNKKTPPDKLSLDEIIREHYPAGGSLACLPHLSGITRYQVASRANRIGVRVRNLSEFCKTRAQNRMISEDRDPSEMSKPWLPIEVVRWVDEATQ